jgi:hypothetical protein
MALPVIPGCVRSTQTRNPEVTYNLWIPGSRRGGAPGNDGSTVKGVVALL